MKNRLISAILAIYLNHASTTIIPEDTPLFEQAIKSPFYVDKTLLLKQFVTGDYFQQITSPKEFGKSTTLDMARRYFQIPFDEKGNVIDRKTTHYYKLFNSESSNFEISKDKNFTEEYFGKYPLLYLNFAHVTGSTSKEVISSIKDKISHAVKPYSFLYQKAKHDYEASKREKDKEAMTHWETLSNKVENSSVYSMALRNITGMIKDHFGREVFLYVVHYDVPYLCTIDKTDVWDVNSFMYTLFYHYVIKRPYVAKPVIFVGVSRVFIRGMLGEFCDIFEASYFQDNSEYFDEYYFALTEHQVDRLLTTNHVSVTDREKLKKYSNGYKPKKILDSAKPQPDKPFLYNTKGVKQFLETKTFKNDFDDPLLPKLMKCLRNPKFFQDITRLLMKQTIDLRLEYHIFRSDLEDLIKVIQNNCSASKWSKDTTHIAHFLDNGYISYGYLHRKFYNYILANEVAENKLIREYERFFNDMYGINIINPEITTSLAPILNTNVTTNESLTNFANTLQKFLQPRLTPNITEFEYQSLIFAGIYRNWNFSRNNVLVTIYPTYFDAIPEDNEILVLPNVDQSILTIIRLDSKRTADIVAFEAREYVPFDHPKDSSVKIVKYVGINLSKDLKVEAAAEKSRYDWSS